MKLIFLSGFHVFAPMDASKSMKILTAGAKLKTRIWQSDNVTPFRGKLYKPMMVSQLYPEEPLILINVRHCLLEFLYENCQINWIHSPLKYNPDIRTKDVYRLPHLSDPNPPPDKLIKTTQTVLKIHWHTTDPFPLGDFCCRQMPADARQ